MMEEETNPVEADEAMIVTRLDDLEALYGEVSSQSRLKAVDHIHPSYRPFIEASPFVALATAGPGGIDVSPRGDPAGFVHIEDTKTLLLPDRRGNNRIDGLRNILHDPRVGLLFLIPGIGETLRVNGRATIMITPTLLKRFVVKGHAPRSVLRIEIDSVFFQCSRAILRSGIWSADHHVARDRLPSVGTILKQISRSFDGKAYDETLDERLKTTLY